jgi:hypothetical protein
MMEPKAERRLGERRQPDGRLDALGRAERPDEVFETLGLSIYQGEHPSLNRQVGRT